MRGRSRAGAGSRFALEHALLGIEFVGDEVEPECGQRDDVGGPVASNHFGAFEIGDVEDTSESWWAIEDLVSVHDQVGVFARSSHDGERRVGRAETAAVEW